jgi:hypothetical protein
MAVLESLLRRLGYVKLSRFDLVLTTDGQLLSRATGQRVDGGDSDFGAFVPSAVSLPSIAAPTRPTPPPIPRNRRAVPRAPSPVIAALPLSPPLDSEPFERAPEEAVEWQRKLVEARSRALTDEEREWEQAMARARAAAETPAPSAHPEQAERAPALAPAPAPARALPTRAPAPARAPAAPAPASPSDEEREWEQAMARARAAAEATPVAPVPAPAPRLARGTDAPPLARPTRLAPTRAPIRGPGAPPSARADHVGRAPRTRTTPRPPRATPRPPLRTGV